MITMCCAKCAEEIAKADRRAVDVWMYLCDVYVRYNGVFALNEDKLTTYKSKIRMLERKRYLSTKEENDYVCVRLEGIQLGELYAYGPCAKFCIRPHKHK